jgi:integrase/recombinase XerC
MLRPLSFFSAAEGSWIRTMVHSLAGRARRHTKEHAFSLAATASPRSGASLRNAIEKFLLSRQVGNCTVRTLEVYAGNLRRFAKRAPADHEACTPTIIQEYLTALGQQLKPISTHQHFRTLKTFFVWCVEAALLAEHPMRGMRMKLPKTLPHVPEKDWVRRLLAACRNSFEGIRNKALIALLIDSGLRISEALGLRIRDLNFAERTISVRRGKGQKDSLAFFDAEAARCLRTWLAKRPTAHPDDFVFCRQDGQPLTRFTALHILQRLSVRAGLPRKLGPHALRHYAATSILRQTGDLELLRRVLRHETLAMALRYAHLTGEEVSAKFRLASPLNNLWTNRS